MTGSEDYLQMSGIQHFSFCRRQWALVYLEQQWSENLRTAEGRLEHERAHDDTLTEKRGGLLIIRGMRVVSHRLRLSGECDVVEFRADEDGVELYGREGRWLPMPVEYKHGASKENDADRLQLCAQAMALEEMLFCDVPRGAIFYVSSRHREYVDISPELRDKAAAMAGEMNEYFRRGYTPKVKPAKHCNACSLKELCLPSLYRHADSGKYVREHIEEAMGDGICGSC